MRSRISILIILFVVAGAAVTSQVRFRVAAGMSTDWITNDNPATYRFVTDENSISDNSDEPYGGALDGVQMGWGVRGYADLDKQKYFRIPFGLDYFMFSGTQRISSGLSSTQVRHDVNLISTMVGFEWSFAEFPMAFARAYIGGEIRPLFVQPNQITTNVINTTANLDTTWTFSGKEAATRLGAMARIGIEGELYYPVFLNTSIAYGVMNLIGRDLRPTSEGGRGELLTAVKLGEGPETYVHHVNFTFMIQVRL